MNTQPVNTPNEIASAALSLWDMLAEETESSDDLCQVVAIELVEYGLTEFEAKRVAVMANAAFDLANKSGTASDSNGDYSGDPIYQAMLEHLQDSNEWSI